LSGVVRPALIFLLSVAMLSAAESHLDDSCPTSRQHGFDFVIGNWLVRDSSGHAVGTATISRAYGGCILIERWLGVGSTGESLGIIGYQPESGSWRRDFLDPGGSVLTLEGQRNGASMKMTGKDYPTEGIRMHRVTWSPRSDGAVEERWQTSADAGRTWQLKFYGRFYRIAE
jgi:hypothetical protein